MIAASTVRAGRGEPRLLPDPRAVRVQRDDVNTPEPSAQVPLGRWTIRSKPSPKRTLSAAVWTLLVEQGVHVWVVQEILGHARVTPTQRYTYVASPQVKDTGERKRRRSRGDDHQLQLELQPARAWKSKAPLTGVSERGFELRRLGDLNPGWA